MRTECTVGQLEFQGLGRRAVVGRFDAGRTSSDGGLLLLREVAERTGLLKALAGCFRDHRKPEAIEHTVFELVAQRVFGLALGYEDLNDHDILRDDTLLAVAVGKRDLQGAHRARKRDRGHALAGKSTLNRLELTPADGDEASRYKKIVYDGTAIDALLIDHFIASHRRAPRKLVLDLDATDDPIHGEQEGRFFHGYYGHYCYLPLYIFCGDFPLVARLRPSNIDASEGALEEVQRVVQRLRARWPHVKIILRADSGFARDPMMTWCERHRVDYVFGLARNHRLESMLKVEMQFARETQARTGKPARLFKELRYRTLDSWSCRRRVVGKAEQLLGKSNPRFVVTSLTPDEYDTRELYEDLYCARGDMENRIKEQQLALFADRTSSHTVRANQLRLWFSTFAYLLVAGLRRLGLSGTHLQRAQADTIRTRLLKIGAVIYVSVRRVVIALSSVFPLQPVFIHALAKLRVRAARSP
jgi:hypothetical protein